MKSYGNFLPQVHSKVTQDIFEKQAEITNSNSRAENQAKLVQDWLQTMIMNIRQILDDDTIMANVLEAALNEIKDNGLQYSPAVKTFK